MKKSSFLIFIILHLLFISCKKKQSAGLGGQAVLKIAAIHHSQVLDSCTIYIKYNSSEAPNISEYDLQGNIRKDSIGNSYILFSGLKKGDYYIYGKGWDPSIFSEVDGGIPYTIKEETLQNVLIPVTETH